MRYILETFLSAMNSCICVSVPHTTTYKRRVSRAFGVVPATRPINYFCFYFFVFQLLSSNGFLSLATKCVIYEYFCPRVSSLSFYICMNEYANRSILKKLTKIIIRYFIVVGSVGSVNFKSLCRQ